MAPIAIFFMLAIGAPAGASQARPATSPAVEEHIRQVIKQLPPDSLLRRALLRGARGDGVHHPWMDEMRRQGIKRVLVWIDIRFKRNGHPKRMRLDRTEYFAQYSGGAPISDAKRLAAIRASGLEKELDNLALQRAARGHWLDVPRPRPHPFLGGTIVEFFDDEWLPGPRVAPYGTR
jgi:hypothetical protein